MDWKDFEKEIENLSSKIDFAPNIVVGVVKGGIIPARLLSNTLKVKSMYCLTVKKLGKERQVTTKIFEDLKGKKIILVEDVLETGRSLIAARQYLEKKGATVKTACLYTMTRTEITPDYYIKRVGDLPKFPWEN